MLLQLARLSSKDVHIHLQRQQNLLFIMLHTMFFLNLLFVTKDKQDGWDLYG